MVMVLFTMSTKAQDTTYIQKRNDLYRVVRTHVTDSTTYKQHFTSVITRHQRNDRIFVTVVASVFIGLTGWFFIK
jgi:hypothetical protein